MFVGSTRWLSGEKASVCGPVLGLLSVSSFRPLWVGSFPSFLPLSQRFWVPAPPQLWRLIPASLSVFQPWQLLRFNPLPFLLQEILVPVRPVTEQQLLWRGRESSKGRQYTTGPLSPASDMADTLESDTFNPL